MSVIRKIGGCGLDLLKYESGYTPLIDAGRSFLSGKRTTFLAYVGDLGLRLEFLLGECADLYFEVIPQVSNGDLFGASNRAIRLLILYESGKYVAHQLAKHMSRKDTSSLETTITLAQ